jgi:hypothetical protein
METELLKAPNGAAITCVTVSTPGRCDVFPPTPIVVEKDDPEYDGSGTEHDYDNQRTFEAGGKIVWRDDCGDGWLGWMLIPECAEPLDKELQDELVAIYETQLAFDSVVSARDVLERLIRDHEKIGEQIAPSVGALNLTLEKLAFTIEGATRLGKSAIEEHLAKTE